MKHGSSTAVVAGLTAALVAGLVTVGGISAAQVGNWGSGQSGQSNMMGPPPMGRSTGGGTGMGVPPGMGKGGQNMSAGMMGGPMAGGQGQAQKITTMKAALQKLEEKSTRIEDRIEKWTERMNDTDDEMLLFFLENTIDTLTEENLGVGDAITEMTTTLTALQKSSSSVSSK